MTRPQRERLADVLTACDAIESHVRKLPEVEDLVFDAIRIRLVEIGEAVKDIDPELLASESNVPWAEIARMRDLLTHRYFDTVHAIVFTTARTDIPLLRAAIGRILANLDR